LEEATHVTSRLYSSLLLERPLRYKMRDACSSQTYHCFKASASRCSTSRICFSSTVSSFSSAPPNIPPSKAIFLCPSVMKPLGKMFVSFPASLAVSFVDWASRAGCCVAKAYIVGNSRTCFWWRAAVNVVAGSSGMRTVLVDEVCGLDVFRWWLLLLLRCIFCCGFVCGRSG
ncbi:hypothetical protein KCU77_g115, partial [Aureobasidium melanogenum]